MRERITINDLRALCDRLNTLTGSPMQPWGRDAEGRNRANIGNFHISQAYGGYSLHRMSNEGGGVSNVLGYGHGPARDLYERMEAYIGGLSHQNEVDKLRAALRAVLPYAHSRAEDLYGQWAGPKGERSPEWQRANEAITAAYAALGEQP